MQVRILADPDTDSLHYWRDKFLGKPCIFSQSYETAASPVRDSNPTRLQFFQSPFNLTHVKQKIRKEEIYSIIKNPTEIE
jgi:hypothetical protein